MNNKHQEIIFFNLIIKSKKLNWDLITDSSNTPLHNTVPKNILYHQSMFLTTGPPSWIYTAPQCRDTLNGKRNMGVGARSVQRGTKFWRFLIKLVFSCAMPAPCCAMPALCPRHVCAVPTPKILIKLIYPIINLNFKLYMFT